MAEPAPAADAYILGTAEAERQRLALQHQLWRPLAQQAWQRAGLAPGQRVLDLGAGPGFAALELAEAVGPTGLVLALEGSNAYATALRQAAAAAQRPWLQVQQLDLATPGIEAQVPDGFQLAWCRWLAMFLPRLDPLLALLERCLVAGGRLVAHEYSHWHSFGLFPQGEAIARFGAAVTASFRAAGGDPDVNRRLPALLAARGFTVEHLQPLPVLASPGDAWAPWLEQFVLVYGAELIRQGRWSHQDAAAAAAEIEAARHTPGSYWLGPTVLELQARRA